MDYKKYDKKKNPRLLNPEFKRILEFANKWFDPDKEKQSLKFKLKDIYLKYIILPLFRRRVYHIIKENIYIIFNSKNINDIKYIINQFVLTLLEFSKEYELDLYEDIINKVIFTKDEKGIFDIKFTYEKTTIYEFIKSYTINFSFISEIENYFKNDFIRLYYNIDLKDLKAEVVVKVYDYDKEKDVILNNIYKYYKSYDLTKDGSVENPNYIYDDNLKKEEYAEIRLLLSSVLQPLAVIILEIFKIIENNND